MINFEASPNNGIKMKAPLLIEHDRQLTNANYPNLDKLKASQLFIADTNLEDFQDDPKKNKLGLRGKKDLKKQGNSPESIT